MEATKKVTRMIFVSMKGVWYRNSESSSEMASSPISSTSKLGSSLHRAYNIMRGLFSNSNVLSQCSYRCIVFLRDGVDGVLEKVDMEAKCGIGEVYGLVFQGRDT